MTAKNQKKKAWLSELKKKTPILIVAAVIVGSLYYLTFIHYQNFGRKNDFIFSMETKLLDHRFTVRGPKKPTKNIGILAIDEKAINEFGRFPFSRRYYEQAFNNLKKLGVSWIAFDAIFSEAEKASVSDVLPLLKQIRQNKTQKSLANEWQNPFAELDKMLEQSPGDLSFARGIQNFGNIVLGYFYFGMEHEVKAAGRTERRYEGVDTMAEGSAIQAVILPEGKELTDYKELQIPAAVTNIPVISAASPHFGFFSNNSDNDAIARWVSLVSVIDGNLMPSMALKVAAEAAERDIVAFFDQNGVESISLVDRKDDTNTIDIPVDPDGLGRLLLNHRGPGRSFHHYSLADAYHNSFTAEEKKNLKGAVLMLGATIIGGNDQRPNPFDPALDGVENHAAALDNILSGEFLKRPASVYAQELYIILIVGLIFTPIILFSRAAYAGVLVVLFLLGYYLFDRFYMFNAKGVWTYMGVPFIEISGLFIVITLYKYFTEEQERKKVKGAFAHYLSPEVISQLLDNPGALKLGGEKKELTVFFSDVRGFTTISESLSPEKLCELMNDYFTPMTSIILRSGGVLDKYIGDAIMAFWGAPIEAPLHPDLGVDAAVQMLYAMDALKHDFRQRGYPEIDIGMGLNTGAMAVGNMGSGERFTYTVMGDAVNLGARLEGLTKEYGIKIMISEFTHAKLTPGKFITRDLDDIRVKGKNEPVRVFEVTRPDVIRQQHLISEMVQSFAAGRLAYQKQAWDDAEKLFMQCIKIRPDDGPSLLYLNRIQYYREHPPGDNWDGVYTFKHK
ncbi:MAG: adenylate/guanylate cyclase domain-containing protein [Oligoflexales bacterium]|nr:adenylate/guanylate cyclase domain-containing protein [Oligoflexales bacterium]